MNPLQTFRESLTLSLLGVCLVSGLSAGLAHDAPRLLNDPIDVSGDFQDFANTYYLADALTRFDPVTRNGTVEYGRAEYVTKQAFDNMLAGIAEVEPNEFPANEYEARPQGPFSVDFVSPRTVRIRMSSGPQFHERTRSLMLAGPVSGDDSWTHAGTGNGHRFTGPFGTVTLTEKPWHVEFHDAGGRLLTRTDHTLDNTTTFTPILPFGYVRRAADYSRSFHAAFTLSPGEKLFGCGESFTGLDKRGQKIVLWVDDPNGVQNPGLYKPVPFFLSSRGYGMFLHTSSPITCDFGQRFSGINSLMIGDDELDLFFFFGSPKEILDEYTRLTGRSPMPPLWSFGLWMSRCSYFSEAQTREVAAKLRANRIPCDVIHLDTGWFETDWRCDYQFSTSRFDDPKRMIADLKEDGFRISLWQLPYFVPKNSLFPELVERGLVVRDAKGNLPYEDAVLDFSNPAAVEWYQEKLAGLLELGVGAIKVDFGEAAPANGIYASGRTGFYEHNLYPLRYNKAAAEVTGRITGEHIIWARSTWAGSQRYPVHWGGDAETTDQGMAAQLRGGLSLGLSGFTFWSHDAGGFVGRAGEDLYRRWLAFAMLTSHSRCHGTAPKEPWEYGEAFMNDFRRIVELKYRLMPYVYAEAKHSSARGLPMVRALFVEYPDDPGSWRVEDEYLLGSRLLVAPILHEGMTRRDVYLPPGNWIDYQTGRLYPGGWHGIEAGDLPMVLLVREGTVLPHIRLAQSTVEMDWSTIELVAFLGETSTATGRLCLPEDGELKSLELIREGEALRLTSDPFDGRIDWSLRVAVP